MIVDEKTVKKVGEVARLNLTEQEIDGYSKDLTNILEAFKELEKVKTDDVEPTFQPIEVKDVLREDIVEPSLSQEEALSNIKKNKEDGQFKAPKVV
ncbi:MAG TPA: Asp-tRNA(Asn)/Glu-tRNA(Gln) amidotransferase subunit GatC [archaeon]|nr:Asp-tRNA(Asn)/Glu-tRNA(Gln) amidotransferase subunit GatC [archaeon]